MNHKLNKSVLKESLGFIYHLKGLPITKKERGYRLCAFFFFLSRSFVYLWTGNVIGVPKQP